MKIRNKDKSKKDLKMNKMKLNYEVMNLANDINKNYHSWLSCVTLTSEYKKESRDFGHGFGVFTGSKYYRIEASGKSGCNSIIDQENSKLYVTAYKAKHVWGFVAKSDSENHKRGDILNKNYKVVGNILDGEKVNLGMPNSHYPNFQDVWAGATDWNALV
tara:strand:- start:54 stop:533 length:480 start_codon:yes stop_codon:yes gene_type:complete